MTAIERFASNRRLKVSRDECNDQIISGARGQLYFDGSKLCLIALDARGSEPTWIALGGKLWLGSIWRDNRNRAHRDVAIRDLPETSVPKALRLLGIRAKRVVSEEQLAVLRDRIAKNFTRDPQKTPPLRG